MSSFYEAICLSHDPAIVDSGEESTPVAALERRRLGHPRCDLLVGRWSGGLIEVICPGMPTEMEYKPHTGWHRDPISADAGLLHVAAVVVQCSENDIVLEAAVRRLPMCWTPQRLRRLASVLNVPGVGRD